MAALDRGRSWRDWAVPAALCLFGLVELWVPGVAAGSRLGPSWVFAIQMAGGCAALTYRRTRPLGAAVVMSACLLVPTLWGWSGHFIAQVLMVAVAVFSCGRYGARPAAYLGAVLGSLLVVAQGLADPEQRLADSWGWSLNTVWIFALGAGFRHEARLREEVGRAAEDRFRASMAEERLRVARELHDTLSHSLSVMIIQAEVADTLFDSDPPTAQRALAQVTMTGRSALMEIRRIVDLLREPGTGPAATSSPTLLDIPALVRRMSEAGLPVALSMSSPIPPFAEEISGTAYRVVQESLTNVLRHAGKVDTKVELTHSLAGLSIKVHNQGSGGKGEAPVPGNGLTGMRERVSACGGELSCGPGSEGGFTVRAHLPSFTPA